ncbi:MAG: endo-1,4-beta-xylanase [Mediterranea sp.]|jgi:GH35 family endo-1,4-beta-xylanase|nr:endo-1,4-beta-xylanase [Mediterranea sp.]
MKHTFNIVGGLLLTAALATSCVDDTKLLFTVEKPASVANSEYLLEYDALKTYLTDPNLKLGAGVTAADYAQQGFMYRVINDNFNEVVAGNAMKYSSVVGDDGTMNFETVTSFVNAAKDAGMSVYGHTLVWHAQQNNKYLNGLLKEKAVEGDGGTEWVQLVNNNDCESDDVSSYFVTELGASVVAPRFTPAGEGADGVGRAILVTTGATHVNNWDTQFFVKLSEPLPSGTHFKFSMKVKATNPVTIESQAHGNPGGYLHWSMAGSPNITTEWAEYTYEGNIPAEAPNTQTIAFNLAMADNTTYYFDDISFEYEKQLAVAWWENIVVNSDCESDDRTSYTVAEAGGGQTGPRFSAPGTGADGVGRAIEVKSGASHVNTWDTQFFVTVNHEFEAGENFNFSIMMKADKDVALEAQAHKGPGGYLHWTIIGGPSVTTEWKEYKFSGAVPGEAAGMNTIAFNLAMSDNTTYYFDDVVWEIEHTGGVPQTPEEKADTLTWALNNWIEGMMFATDGYVTAWDVVNEPLSGADKDGDGKYDLQSVTNVSADDAKNNFYWQDYLGENYVRTAIKLARENSTAPLKLFVNDYNLESDWDDNGKLKSLIKWVEQWESDGVTKIDGIGTQMHVSYHLNPATQASKEQSITKMFELLAATGKLIKISELDMGLADADGSKILTPAVTEEQARGMSAFYTFIIKEYLRLIPANQRYGITQWATTDSPDTANDTNWRDGEPIGLWTIGYDSRKHTYAGFADGLAGN